MKYAFIDEHRSGFRVKKIAGSLMFQGAGITHGEGVPRGFGKKKMNACSKRSKKPIK